jgi:nucleoside-diphosphate-sugar epimerase
VKALVTGGGGYIGRHVVAQLVARGDDVTVLGRHRYPDVEALGARGVTSDLGRDDPALAGLFAGMDVVFHTAAMTPIHAPRSAFTAINVDGTRRVIEACRAAGVSRLVFTSTPSVAHADGDTEGLREEQCPYPDHYESPYADTKAEAERMVLAANDATLATTALRPHIVYGPDEPHMLPRILARHRAGRLRIIGDGKNRVGLTYVDNAAAAHVQAGDALAIGSANAGRPYFVTDAEPVVLWSWLNALFAGVGLPPLERRVSLGTARAIGAVAEAAWAVLPLKGEPPMTRFVATQLATSHWFDLSNGRRDFGLAPVVDGDEGLRRTIGWFAR